MVHGLNYQNYAYQFELIVFAIKGEEYHPKRKVYKTDLIKVQRVNNNNEIEHETVKPLKLLRGIIEDNSNEGDLVLDCFMGSGTTAIACKQLNRNFIGCEINEKYVNICNKRLSQETLLNKGVLF